MPSRSRRSGCVRRGNAAAFPRSQAGGTGRAGSANFCATADGVGDGAAITFDPSRAATSEWGESPQGEVAKKQPPPLPAPRLHFAEEGEPPFKAFSVTRGATIHSRIPE